MVKVVGSSREVVGNNFAELSIRPADSSFEKAAWIFGRRKSRLFRVGGDTPLLES